MALVVIPARGGSVGVPRKNLRIVGGRSLIERAVTAAMAADSVDAVIVSTDDDDIAEMASRTGAEVLIRPSALAVDMTTSEQVLLHAVESLEPTTDILAMVQCTSPFIEPADIDGTVGLISSGKADSSFTGTPFHGFVWEGATNVTAVNHDDSVRPMRQERHHQYLETGAVYAMRLDGFLETKHRFFGTIAVHEVPRIRSIEIDTPEDLELARRIAEAGRENSTGAIGPLDAVAMDFDGVLTDNKVFVSEDGTESVRFDRGDGLGISLLKEMGVQMIVLSTEQNPVVAKRCTKLGIPYVQELSDKRSALERWLAQIGVDPRRTAFIGNDINDLSAMRLVGFPIAPCDAHPDVVSEARVVLSSQGGRGAIREFASRVIADDVRPKGTQWRS